MTVGWIGLGNLGFAMAKRLKEAGTELAVWNRSVDKAEKLGVPVAFSPAELLSASDAVFVNVFDSNAVADVLHRPGGLLQGNCREKIVIDTTTNHPGRVAEFHALFAAKGAHYLEAPVLGSVGPASQGTLTMLVSGDEQALRSVRSLVSTLCKEIFYVGKAGVATRMKLINNLVLGSFMATIAEATAAGEKAGIDRGTVLAILAAGAGNSGILNAKKEKLLHGDFAPQFSVSAIEKDLSCLADLFSELDLPSETLRILRSAYQKAESTGSSNDDFSAVYRVFRQP